MTQLSVNVNKVATLRNSRGGNVPSVLEATATILDAGAPGITVHPREDQRHIRPQDVLDIAALLERRRRAARGPEFNIEGDPRADLIDLVLRVRPDQCTLVPVTPGEITSHAGWRPDTDATALRAIVARLKAAGIRVSLFVDPDEEAVRWAASMGGDRIELYTEPFARAFGRSGADAEASFDLYRRASLCAHAVGLGVNAGHDLDTDNLVLFRQLPHLDEVSIGHALISRALWIGLTAAVHEYLAVLRPDGRDPATARR